MAKRGRPPKISEAHNRVLDLTEEEYLKEVKVNDIAKQIEGVAGERTSTQDHENDLAWMKFDEAMRIERSAMQIATALFRSGRSYTLNEGFAKQCVEFATFISKEAKRVSDSNQ